MNHYKSKAERIKEDDQRIKAYTEKDPTKAKPASTDVDSLINYDPTVKSSDINKIAKK